MVAETLDNASAKFHCSQQPIMRPPKHLQPSDVITLLRLRFSGCTIEEMAAQLKVSQAHVYDVLEGRRNPGPSILDYLKLEKRVETIITYLPIGNREPAGVEE